ncbi:spliced leader RNA PSE-promoter transcription factor [Trypanosoma theileri]|uniref:Spliced leader RNA PSE-promoter transcription factor n=1 Tax=Trypanosoma theileri TaxID=67003 RepID=A0A1X0NT43_9TRYP|nr:spliced leader RNA PSE-promoter transcription factor [Trypanosoma theileri]ORC87633.1 spliced leader RNA PSE-promoter transcription factor [Trypanosoma theileri]
MRRRVTFLFAKAGITDNIHNHTNKNSNINNNSNKDGPSPYRPRFRPRRLVMPVNPSDVHSNARSNNPLWEKYKAQRRLRRAAERRGAVTLATVPAERSVGDAFRLMLDVCEKEKLFSESASLTPKHLRHLEELLSSPLLQSSDKSSESRVNENDSERHTSPFYALGLAPERDNLMISLDDKIKDNSQREMALREVDAVWRMLDNTPLDSPVHGVLAMRGKAIVERTIANMAYAAFPRLRSKHLQALIHESCGLYSCGRVALRLGFADMCNVNGEISMWRELNVLTERFHIAKRKAAIHLQRIEKGVAQQRRWYWKGVLRSAAMRLKLFPVHQEDILPRMEWIRDSIFAFIAFIELAENSGDDVKLEPLIKKLFCSQLGSFLHANQILDNAQQQVERILHNSYHTEKNERSMKSELRKEQEALAQLISTELQKIRQMTEDELEMINEQIHPMNIRSDARKDQFASSGGAHATQSLRDDIFDDYRVTRHHKMAPPVILHCIQPQNALKETQIILRYDPNVPSTLSNAPIDVDQVIRRVTEVHETNPYATLYTAQQYRQVEYTVCRLYAGKRCIGQGKGESLMEAMNEAAQHTLLNYYLKKNPPKVVEHKPIVTTRTECEEERATDVEHKVAEVRVNETLDEEIFF